MAVLTIRDVPDDQMRTLEVRAAQTGQSVQSYVKDVLAREAAKPTLSETMARLDREASAEVTARDVRAALEETRSGR